MPVPGKAPKGYEAFSTLNPQQSGLMNMIMQLLSGQGGEMGGPFGYLQELLSGSPEAFSKFEAPYQRQFQEETIPGLAERFSGQGAQRSSAFGQALSSAGAGLSENLANLREQLRTGAATQALGLGQTALGTNTMGLVEKQQPFWKQLLTGLAPGIGQGIGMGVTGGLGGIGKGLGGLGDWLGGWQSSYGGQAQSRRAGQGITQTRMRG